MRERERKGQQEFLFRQSLKTSRRPLPEILSFRRNGNEAGQDVLDVDNDVVGAADDSIAVPRASVVRDQVRAEPVDLQRQLGRRRRNYPFSRNFDRLHAGVPLHLPDQQCESSSKCPDGL